MFKKLLSTFAPALGTIVGGPIGGIAAKAISSILLPDNDNPTENELAHAYANATPEQIEKIKSIVSLAKIDADDRKNARDRERDLKDWMPSILSTTITVGYFTALYMLHLDTLTPNNAEFYGALIGSLSTVFVQVVSYYFGSSRRDK